MPSSAVVLVAPLVGACILVTMGAVHSILGERLLLRPLAGVVLPPVLGRKRAMYATLRTSWHLLTLAWWGLAAVLASAAIWPGSVSREALRLVAFCVLVTGAVILVASRGRHPAWLASAIAAACAWAT